MSRKVIKNEYKIIEDYVIIYLKKRNGDILETYIDLEDFDKVITNWTYRWFANYYKYLDDYYAASTIYLGLDENKKPIYKRMYLHQLVLDSPEDCDIDHINKPTLNNRKSNLRVTLHEDNNKNRKSKNSNNTSGYRNVSWFDSYQKWVVQLQVEGKNKILGQFDDVDEAGVFAEEMRQKYYGEFAGKN